MYSILQYKFILKKLMKHCKVMQISFKNYTSEYKQCKTIERNEQFDLLYVRNISTRKKHLVLRKLNCQESEAMAIIHKLSIYEAVEACTMINQLVGYSLEHFTLPKKGPKLVNVYLVYQFGENSLNSTIQSHAERSRQESVQLVQSVCDHLLEACSYLSSKNLELKSLSFDFKLISFDSSSLLGHRFSFSYLPFEFIGLFTSKPNDFTKKIYSLRELQIMSSQERPNQIQLILQKSERGRHSQAQMLQKIGLLLIKLMLLTCQQVKLREGELDLYAVNSKFDIDYNWQLIKPLLTQCFRIREYRSMAKIIKFMIFNKEEHPFQYYCRQIEELFTSNSPVINSNKKEEESKSQSKKKDNSRNIYDNISLFNELPSNIATRKITIKEQIIEKKQKLERQINQLGNVASIYHENGRYVGQTNQGKRQGLGMYYFREGQIYGGQWRDDEMMGQGTYLFLAEGEYYEGNVNCGIRSGYGCYYYKDGKVYKGDWLNDKKQGYGEFSIGEKQQVYKGMFKNNQQQGNGTIQYANGSRFQGVFKQGMRNGVGYIYNPKNKLTLKALWQDDKIAGKAEIFFEIEDYYYGELKNGKMHGQGMYRYKQGTICQGHFQNNQLRGQVKINYHNGDQYAGEFQDGKINNIGSYYYRSENMTETCNWVDNQQAGETEFLYEDRVFVGHMSNRRIKSGLKEKVSEITTQQRSN